MASRRYLLITPCRNEAKVLKTTLDTTIAYPELQTYAAIPLGAG